MISYKRSFGAVSFVICGIVALASTADADSIVAQELDISVGLAERTLASFSQRSDQPAIFPVDRIRGVKTMAVKGMRTPLEALSLMLMGTKLVPAIDRQNGTLVTSTAKARTGRAGDAAAGTASGETILLPPFEVEEETRRPWLYAQHAGASILFRCSEHIATETLDRHYQLNRMLAILLPPHLQPSHNVPAAFVLEDADYESVSAKKLKQEIFRNVVGGGSGQAADFLPSFYFRDDDVGVFYQVFNFQLVDGVSVTVAPAYVQYLLEVRTPRLPKWFAKGVMKLLETTVIPVPGIALHSTSLWPQLYPYDKITVRPMVWGSVEETNRMQMFVKAEARRTSRVITPVQFPLLPMGKLLEGDFDEDDTGDNEELASLQAALFLRWIFDPKPSTPAADKLLRAGEKPKANDLWNYIARSEREGVTEKLFEDCFGWTYAEMDTLLRSYLPFASLRRMSAEFVLTSTEPIVQSIKLEARDASATEVARIKGRLNRLSIGYVRLFSPQYLPTYAAQARRTLQRGLEADSSDLQLLAELGLCEVDAGSDGTAEPFLSAAVQAELIHPRIYYELSRIQFSRLRAIDPGLGTSRLEAERISGQLLFGLKQAPALPQAYELLFEIWLRGQAELTAAQADVLNEGARLFPGRFRVIYPAILLLAARGDVLAAEQIGRRARHKVEDRDESLKIEQLLQSLTAHQP